MIEKQIIERIQNAIDYIEEHLYEKIEIEDIAKITYMSLSSFYIVFSNVLGTTVKDYIRKRRLSLSAYDLVKSNMSILDIALKYQYCTYESYSRAFKKLFGISPKKYRNKNLYTNVFPRVNLTYQNLSGGINMINKEMNRDIIINKISSINSGFILDIDIDHFQQINEKYGYNIGDKVLIEVPERIKTVLNNYELDVDVTRINADEFVVIIKDKSKDFIEKISSEIINIMTKEFVFDEVTLSVTVSIGISKFTVDCNDEEVINSVKKAMILAKKSGRNRYKLLNY
ncbi:diguanylate cyclase domain-containing protein [Caloranaerobacter sp. TR13]|uniref:diguanylate cyclase domain-containing protein n=1 Tax=Caloranaerobacter sp. TR13 TaxID=1302151 RepID=UPI0006D46974|nr:diguanylate cyclase [Caloranaerobacter sp. TR13]